MVLIAVMSHKYCISTHWQLKCLFNSLFKLTSKKNTEALLYWPLLRGIHRRQVDCPHKEAVMQEVCPCCHIIIWGLWEQVSQAGISNYIMQFTVRCNYLFLPEIPVFGAKVLILSTWSTAQQWLQSIYRSFELMKTSLHDTAYLQKQVIGDPYFGEYFAEKYLLHHITAVLMWMF